MNSFKELALAPELIQALDEINFTTPTETQVATLPLGLAGKDMAVCAATGSGKTAAFGIPIVNGLLKKPGTRALILAPTRELAQQITVFMKELIQFCPDLKIVSIVGGADIRRQMNGLAKNPQIIVATPGRLIDHIKRKTVNLSNINFLVLDEGDRMLDLGFTPQLEQILKYLPKRRQSSLFTATMSMKVRQLANQYLQSPEAITVGERSMPVKSIKQSVIQVDGKQKYEKILDVLNDRSGSVIIFVKTKKRTDFLFKTLKSYGYDVTAVHGDKTQGQRNKAIKQFRDGTARILCATDVAARGLDVPQVEHVINFDLPMMQEDYVHRIGRTARNGAAGEAVSFVSVEDHRAWLGIAKKYQIPGVELKNVSIRLGGFKKKSASRPGAKKKKKRVFSERNSGGNQQFKKKKRNAIKNAPKNKKRNKPRAR